MKLYLDPGHGGSDPGAQGNGLNEKDITLDIALRLRTILLNYYDNVEVLMSRTSDITKSLSERTNEANSWGADYYLSIHINSDSNSAQGYEDYIYSGLSNISATAKYQNIIHTEVIKVNQLKDRGQKQENFHVLRESSMPALLTENGFIDNLHDAALMKQSSWRESVAQGHANGLARAFNLKRRATFPDIPGQTNHPSNPLPATLFKVIAGSFQSKKNAEERVAYLRSKGFQAFVNTITISGQIWYRAQTGAYANRANAEQQLEDLKKAGINDAFLAAETVGTTSTANSAGNISANANTGNSSNSVSNGRKSSSPQSSANNGVYSGNSVSHHPAGTSGLEAGTPGSSDSGTNGSPSSGPTADTNNSLSWDSGSNSKSSPAGNTGSNFNNGPTESPGSNPKSSPVGEPSTSSNNGTTGDLSNSSNASPGTNPGNTINSTQTSKPGTSSNSGITGDLSNSSNVNPSSNPGNPVGNTQSSNLGTNTPSSQNTGPGFVSNLDTVTTNSGTTAATASSNNSRPNANQSINSTETAANPNGTAGSTLSNSTESAQIPALPSVDTILGPTYLSPEHMNQFVKSINSNAPELGIFYQTFGKQYGIRGDVAFAQALFETNYLRFTGVVQPDQNNFAGLGSTGPSSRGAYFKTPEDGVLAQMQHLFAYATTKPLPGPYPLVDPRFHLVDRGSATSWTALNGKWAYPGNNYGQSILNLYQRMIDFTLQHLSTIRNGLHS